MSFDEEHYKGQEPGGIEGAEPEAVTARFSCGHTLLCAPGQALLSGCTQPGCGGVYVCISGLEPRGIKYDIAKPMMDLIPPVMELEVAHVLSFGAQKYGPENWRQVPDLRRRYIAAAKRHINALQQGEERDPESGLHHAAHAVCCLMFLGEVEMETGAKS